MAYSSKDIKALVKNAVEMIGKDDITAAVLEKHDGKPELALVRGDVFQDLHSENNAMKDWIHKISGIVFHFNDAGVDRKQAITAMEMMCADGLTRFLSPEPDYLKQKMLEFQELNNG